MGRQDHRRHERILTDAPVKLRWRSPSGESHFGRGRILDQSSEGVRIEVGERLEPRSYITLDAPELNMAPWTGWASVRHCSQKRLKYVVGLELSAGARWDG